jgi:hypothetical protein
MCGVYGTLEEEDKRHVGYVWGNLMERDNFEDWGVGGRILQWILKKYCGRSLTGLICLGQGQVVRCCEHGNELLSCINLGNLWNI